MKRLSPLIFGSLAILMLTGSPTSAQDRARGDQP
jgi:hypothetical protein